MMKNRREKLFIEPSFQKSFLIFIVLLSVSVNVMYFVGNLVFFRNFRQIGTSMNLPSYHAFFHLLDTQERQMMFIFATVMVIVTLVCVVLGLYMSNRVAGPIYRLRRHLESITRGEKAENELQFREKDYFLELAESYRNAHGVHKKA